MLEKVSDEFVQEGYRLKRTGLVKNYITDRNIIMCFLTNVLQSARCFDFFERDSMCV